MTLSLKSIVSNLFSSAVLACLAVSASSAPAAEKAHQRWEPEIRAFERADKTNPPPLHAIIFVGSSSIRLWKTLAEDFAGLPVVNRGFGGCEMGDVTYFADRIVVPSQPRQVVVYAGDNDIADGLAPERVLADFKEFVSRVHRALPDTAIAYIAIKPSPSRWHLAKQVRQANSLIAAFIASEPKLTFIDVFTPMLGPDGQPRANLFIADKLHMNAQGYTLWTAQVRPYLLQ